MYVYSFMHVSSIYSSVRLLLLNDIYVRSTFSKSLDKSRQKDGVSAFIFEDDQFDNVFWIYVLHTLTLICEYLRSDTFKLNPYEKEKRA